MGPGRHPLRAGIFRADHLQGQEASGELFPLGRFSPGRGGNPGPVRAGRPRGNHDGGGQRGPLGPDPGGGFFRRPLFTPRKNSPGTQAEERRPPRPPAPAGKDQGPGAVVPAPGPMGN